MRRKNRNLFGVKMVLPSLVMMFVMFILAFIVGISYAFTNYRLDRPKKIDFVFLQNFIKILSSDHKFYEILGFTLLYSMGVVLIAYVVGFAIALLLNQDVPGRGLFRALILLPWVISSSVVAANWKWLLNDKYGFINVFLQQIGIIDKPILFLARPGLAQATVIFIGAWKTLPFMTIVILAGLQSISFDLYESAAIDGAGFWASLRYITMPGIRGITTMCTMLQFIWTFNNFENVYLMTAGGPNDATFTLPIYIYQLAFERSRIAYAAAVAVIVLICMAFFSAIRFRLEKEE